MSTLRENGFDSSEFVVRAGAPRGGGPFRRDNYTGAIVLVAASRSIRFHATGRLKFCTEERATPMRKECVLRHGGPARHVEPRILLDQRPQRIWVASVCVQERAVYFRRKSQHAVTLQEAGCALEDLALVSLHLARGARDSGGPHGVDTRRRRGHSRRASIA